MEISKVLPGLKVIVVDLGNTEGMIINPRHLSVRRLYVVGEVVNYVSGHGGDVWFIKHQDSDEVGAYAFKEFEPVRTEFDHNYVWHEELCFWYNVELGNGKNPVQIFPPSNGRTDWWVVVPRIGNAFDYRGEDVEARCFATAAGYITQNQGPA